MKMVVKITNVQTKFICVETDTIEEGQEMVEEMVASDEFEFSNENITYEIRDVISEEDPGYDNVEEKVEELDAAAAEMPQEEPLQMPAIQIIAGDGANLENITNMLSDLFAGPKRNFLVAAFMPNNEEYGYMTEINARTPEEAKQLAIQEWGLQKGSKVCIVVREAR